MSSDINGTENTYSYYPGGLRKTKDGAAYIYDGKNILAEITGENIRLNVYGNALLFIVEGTVTVDGEEISVSGKIAYAYGFNLHGDVVRVLSVAGLTLNSYRYDAFGVIVEQTEAVANTFYYSGYEYDSETGLYYLRSRYYNPETARFLTEDSFSGYYNDPLSLNKYTYCHNNPVSYHDPEGTFILTALIIGAVIGAVVGGAVGAVASSNANGGEVKAKDVVIGAVVGGLLGGLLGLGIGTLATAGAPALLGTTVATTKVGASMLVSSTAAMSTNLVYQSANLKKGETIDTNEVLVEQVVGAIGSQVGNAATEIVKVVKKPVLKALTAFGLNFATGMMLDSGAQLATEGEIDTGRALVAGLTDAVTSVGLDFISGEFRTKVPDKRIVNTIETPYGKAQQNYSMEALELRNKVKNGEVELYRGGVLGVSETTKAQFWAPEPL